MKSLLREKAVNHAAFLTGLIARNPEMLEAQITADLEKSDLAADVKQELIDRASRRGGLAKLLQDAVSRMTPEAATAEINNIDRQLLRLDALEGQAILPQFRVIGGWRCNIYAAATAGAALASFCGAAPATYAAIGFGVWWVGNCVEP